MNKLKFCIFFEDADGPHELTNFSCHPLRPDAIDGAEEESRGEAGGWNLGKMLQSSRTHRSASFFEAHNFRKNGLPTNKDLFSGNLGTWKSGNLGSRKIPKIKILKIKIRSVQNVGKVWISRKKNLPAPFGAIPGHFLRGPEKCKKLHLFAYFSWWALAAIHPWWGYWSAIVAYFPKGTYGMPW